VNLLQADEGRPIHHFAHAFKNVDLHTRAENVLEKGERIEHEIEGKAGAWYRFRALPYLTADEVVKGVVLTFIDITEEKQLRGALAAERQRRRTLEAAADTTDPPPAAVPPTSSPTDSEDA
jgi:two-component system CheB/CheR fusion protein